MKNLYKQIYKMYKAFGFKKTFIYCTEEFKNKFIFWVMGSYSQKGEDLIIYRLLAKKKKGFYVDIGAHSPDNLSNTKMFYKKGWSGINIDPDPNAILIFSTKRPLDRNLKYVVSTSSGYITFFEFFPNSLSTTSPGEAEKYKSLGYKLIKKYKVRTEILSNILNKYVKGPIDFFSIDVEGAEMDVLKSNNWRKFRPKVLCIETAEHDLIPSKNKKKKMEINLYLKRNGYLEYSTNGLNTIYVDIHYSHGHILKTKSII